MVCLQRTQQQRHHNHTHNPMQLPPHSNEPVLVVEALLYFFWCNILPPFVVAFPFKSEYHLWSPLVLHERTGNTKNLWQFANPRIPNRLDHGFHRATRRIYLHFGLHRSAKPSSWSWLTTRLTRQPSRLQTGLGSGPKAGGEPTSYHHQEPSRGL